MRMEIVLSKDQYGLLKKHSFTADGNEQLAFGLAGKCDSQDRCRLLVREVILVQREDLKKQSPAELELSEVSSRSILLRAD
jgi:hypothetical protein